MIIFGLLAAFAVFVQSCQSPKNDLDRFGIKSLKRLQVLSAPPIQPSGSYKNPFSEEMTLRDYRGKYVLLNVWATWCPPCIAEMPSLNELSKQRGGEAFAVVTISMDRDMEDADKFFQKHKLDYLDAWHDDSFSLNAKVRTQGLPVSIIYDPNGKEVLRVTGEADWASPEALALIDHLLARPR